jgi:hypothetical protein
MGGEQAEPVIVSEHPRGCYRLDTRAPIEVSAATVALVAAVASERPGTRDAPMPDPAGDTWRELERRLDEVTKAAEALGSRIPRTRDPRLARRIALGLDALLANVAAGHGALDLAIGEGLVALDTGLRAMNLGYSCVGDYAREQLGLNESTAMKKVRLARKLRERALVREALRKGEITPRKAEIIAPVAVGDDQMRWILRAKGETVRALRKAVTAKPDADDEEWHHLGATLPQQERAMLDEGLRWGGIVIGARSKKFERVEAWGQEYLSSHEVPEGDDTADNVYFSSDEDLEWDEEQVERESRRWAHLAAVDPVKGPEFSGEVDPWKIGAELKGLVGMRDRWDEVLGKVALEFKRARAWEILSFGRFGQYCEERLGMAKRTVAQRVALERSLQRIPLLRQALREKRITYEKARVIARHVDGGHVNELRPLIAKAEKSTCVDLRENLEVEAEEQMCARGTFGVVLPRHITELLKDTFRAIRAIAKRWLSAGEYLLELATHFVEVWKAHVRRIRMTRRQRILARGRHRCQVPGCSRPAVHSHHIEFLSQGGSDDDENQIGLCAAHHLRGIHDGLMRVTGKAPDELVWEFGLRRSWAATAVLLARSSPAGPAARSAFPDRLRQPVRERGGDAPRIRLQRPQADLRHLLPDSIVTALVRLPSAGNRRGLK